MDEELTRIQFQLNAGGLLFGVNGGHRAKCICMKPAMCIQRCTMRTFVQHWMHATVAFFKPLTGRAVGN